MDATTNSLNWFEIPASDISRAVKFYDTIFEINMEVNEMMGMKMAAFPSKNGSGKANGAIVQGPMHKPSMDGAIVYLNGNSDLSNVLDKIEGSGGKIIVPKTQIAPEIGFMAFFVDTEGNRMALHSQG